MSQHINVPLTTETLKAIKDAASSAWSVDPETGEHYRENGGMSLLELLSLMSGSLGGESVYEDGVFVAEHPTITIPDLVVHLVEEIERLRG